MTSSEIGGNVTLITAEPDINCSTIEDGTPPCSSEQDWYNATSCECLTFPLEELSFFDPPGIAFLTVAILSVLLDAGVVIVFIQFRHTPIVKASNRELSFLLLFVLLCCFSFPVLQIGPAETWRCIATNCQGPVTTCVYAIFLVKTHRVLSIFEARLPKVVHRQWILGRSLQVVGVFVLTLVQVIISTVYGTVLPPTVEYKHDPDLRVTYAECKSHGPLSVMNSVYPMLLTVLCLCFAFRARRLPENYGESRHILATMAVCLTVYFTCFGVSLTVQGVVRTIVLNISLSFTPLAQLVLLFFPKVYIILVCPERNTVQELRKMTLAHMQKQSEFSPTEGGGRDGDCKRQSQAAGRLKSLRSLRKKVHGVPSGMEASQNGSAATGTRKKSVHILENGKRDAENGLQRNASGLHRESTREGGTSVTTVTNASIKSDVANPIPPHKHRLKDSMRRQSSGLFVIQFLEEVKEREESPVKTLGDCPVKFSLRETDSEGEGEGDMFVVSMLGKTLTLTVEDSKTGVPEILGGVYVGSKTVPTLAGAMNESNKTNASPSKANSDKSITEAQEGSGTIGHCLVETQDGKDMGQGTKVPRQENFGMDVNNDEQPVLDVKSVLIHNCDISTEYTEARTKTRETGDHEFPIEDVFRDKSKSTPTPESLTTLFRGATENGNTLESDMGKVIVSADDRSPISCLAGNTDRETTNSEVPRDHRSLSAGTNAEDAVSVGSLSSNSTFCETSTDDKRSLLGGRSRDLVPECAKGVSLDESNPVDMSDICVQMSPQ